MNYWAFIYKVLCQHSEAHLKGAVSALLELTNLRQTLSVKTELETERQTENSAIKTNGCRKKKMVNTLLPSRKLDTPIMFLILEEDV